MAPVRLGPLSGWSIAVTADRRSGEQIELLTRKGAHVVHGPLIRTHPLGVEADLASAIWSVIETPPEVTLLSTGIGVRAWIEAAESLDCAEPLLDALRRSEVLARGPKAHGAAVTVGLEVDWQTPAGRSTEMVAELERRGVRGRRVAVQLDGAVRAPLADAVRALGAEVTAVPVYRWTLPEDLTPAERLLQAICDRRIDAVTFTARPQVENLCELAEEAGRTDELRAAFAEGDVVAVCVGPVCADGARRAGLGDPVVPPRPRLGSMVMALADAFADRARTLDLAGAEVRLQGRLVALDGEVVALTDRERDVLVALADRPGVVRSKQQLLEAVWGNDASDEHVVEVTVGRLRQRLGPHGAALETVFRRGYRLAPSA
jgi:uroporphyrinogen-III synthase